MEPFAKPTLKQRDKLLEFTGDPIGFFLMKCGIKAMYDYNPDKRPVEQQVLSEWVRVSRLMFMNFPAAQVHSRLYDVYADWSDEVWEKGDRFIEVLKKQKKKSKSKVEFSGNHDIVSIAQTYGVEVRNGRSKCPFHDGTNKTSLALDRDKGLFNCFSCHTSGDLIKFVQLMEQKNE